MYLMSHSGFASLSFCCKYLAKFCKIGLPLASVSPIMPSCSCPAPSATTTTAWFWRSTTRLMCANTPPSPSSGQSISGIRHTSVFPEANAACIAMKPD